MFDKSSCFLLVDDMASVRAMLIKILTNLGYSNFLEASNGNEAFLALEKANPPVNVIISDLHMPVYSGLEFLKKVRADRRYLELPFLMLTNETDRTYIVESIRSGATHYVVKPFSEDMIKRKLLDAYHKKT